MYEDFYELEKPPFRMTPDPKFLYPGPSHQEALAAIVYGVEQRKGFIVMVGEVGLGKTTILRSYLAEHDPKRLSIAYIFNANLGFKALLETIFRELSIANAPDDVAGMVDRLHEVFIEEYRQGRNVVLFVDEAQNIPIETLENLRVLSNIETETDKLLQIVLVGQPEFAEMLDLPELRQLKQRVAVRATLSALTDAQSLEYIEHRLNKAGSSSSAVFTRGALRKIVRHARGVPRILNILCDNALVTGLGYQKKPVSAAIVKEIIGDLEGKVRTTRQRWVWVSGAALFVTGMVLVGSPLWSYLLPASDAVMTLPIPVHVQERPASWWSRELPTLAPPSDDGSRLEAIRPVAGTAALESTGQRIVATRVVNDGDMLFRMAVDVYGFANAEVLRRIVAYNPGIAEVDRILVGTVIRFPDVSDLKIRTTEPVKPGQGAP